MNKQDIILDKICSYYLPDGSYELSARNIYINAYQLVSKEIYTPETKVKLYNIFKLYNINVILYWK